ncbi:PDR/VanB family oxidoreductase [Verticiella sediminum]|uniref:PDR/VanB family oxidoreductase n=1 Tax=Verticiella sediminum TaxID=1247510 RepID=UPI001FEAF468|nr:PDR/VanB family oxidoreductase [Verticiella sediminum]
MLSSPIATTLELVVHAVEQRSPDIVACTLAHPEGERLPAWEAGAHIDVHLPNGMVRQYSLCGDPAQPGRYQIAVKREAAGRGGSAALCDAACAGARLRVGLPRNQFALADASHYLLLGGGIGVTPLLAMAHTLHARGAEFTLAVFARSPGHLPLPADWGSLPWADRVRLHLDDGAPKERADLAGLLAQSPATGRVYVCGPAGFMDAVRRASPLPADRIHSEHFSAPGAAGATAAGASFEAILARQDGRRVRVGPDQTLAEALHAAGVDVDMVCEQGICGSCVTRFLDGAPIHGDTCLTAEERQTHVAVCCARSATPTLTLDL